MPNRWHNAFAQLSTAYRNGAQPNEVRKAITRLKQVIGSQYSNFEKSFVGHCTRMSSWNAVLEAKKVVSFEKAA